MTNSHWKPLKGPFYIEAEFSKAVLISDPFPWVTLDSVWKKQSTLKGHSGVTALCIC